MNAPKITLYAFFDNDRSNRVRWCLRELGLEFSDYQNWKPGERYGAEFGAISPFGKIPGLTIDGIGYFDSAAICLSLADKYYKTGLAPAIHEPARKDYYEWCFTAMTTIESLLA